MKFLSDAFEKLRPQFGKGGKYEKLHYVFEGFDTFLFVPNTVTSDKGVQVRDAIDLKRLMFTVVVAMIPPLLFGMWNVGHQHFLATGEVMSWWPKFWLGFKITFPIIVVSYVVGLGIEFVFCSIRKHQINEGFLVTGMLIPLIVPPTIPLWEVALATAFAVVIGKEVFGGTGMNIVNVALTARAFLYFAYPAEISGEIWTYIGDKAVIDGYSGATPLAMAAAAEGTQSAVGALSNTWMADIYSFNNLFFGFIPGSIGETSVLMCLIGAVILILSGTGSWKIMVSVFAGAYFMAWLFNIWGANPFMEIAPQYHLVLGGLAFGAVYMATDPVTAAQTERGKWIYGFLIGLLTVLIRVFNPAYPEGIMLAILLMNVFAPLIDFYIVKANKKRRLQRATV
ncbi:NADH:ubiquinone reductase (Na(+)-transporting) subunit B [Bacteroidota bacterium]